MSYSYGDDWMARNLRVAPAEYDASHRYHADPVPRSVHQIWLGPRPVPRHTERWRRFCETHGWSYRLWREEDVAREKLTNEAAYRRFEGNLLAMSDVARYEILFRYGGLYADCDITPASADVDLADHLPMTGFAVSTEHVPRNIQTGALFAANGFMVSSPGHPILRRVIASLPINIESLDRAGTPNSVWAVGPFLLNKCLFGVFHVVHRDWVMVDAPADGFHLVEFPRS